MTEQIVFYHLVNGHWYRSIDARTVAKTMEEYTAQVRQAYGNVRGVKFCDSTTHEETFIGDDILIVRPR